MTSTSDETRDLVRRLREKTRRVKAQRDSGEQTVKTSRSGQYVIVSRSGGSTGRSVSSVHDEPLPPSPRTPRSAA